jgi:hypothetical protein
MAKVSIRIQKNQIKFFENVEIDPINQPGVLKDVLQFGLESMEPQHKDLPTYGIRVEVDPGTPITYQDLQTAIEAKVAEIKAQFALDKAKRDWMGNAPGITEDENFFYATITV